MWTANIRSPIHFDLASRYLYAFIIAYAFVLTTYTTESAELTFELPDNAKQCFYESIDRDIKVTLEYQVITGGNYDVDLEISSPNGKILYQEQKKQYDQFTWKADQRGVHKFCFSNEFSTFAHKVVYFDFQVGDEEPLVPSMADHHTALTQLESSAQQIHETLKTVLDYQTHHRLREHTGRAFAEDLNEQVLYWSVGQSVLILIILVGEILVLKSFFSDRK